MRAPALAGAAALVALAALAVPARAGQAAQARAQLGRARGSDRAGGRLVRSQAAVISAGADVVLLGPEAPLPQAWASDAATSNDGGAAPEAPVGAVALAENLSLAEGSQAGQAPLTVFYHVYQADVPGGEEASSSIVQEQMSVMRSSAAFGEGVELKYVFVGPSGSSVPSLLDCPTCHQLESRQTGDEVLTLQHLFEHCRLHPSERVLYMHNKGSFHNTPQNQDLRRFLTKGVWSDPCQRMPLKCSACASRFSPLPHQHYPGNMWVARCGYVSRLIPPSSFQAAMEKVTLLSGATPPLTAEGRPWEIGLGRFALEHWLPSHPSHAPCEVYGGTDFLWAYAFIPTHWAPELHVLPRPDMPLSQYCKARPVGGDQGCDQNLTKVKEWRLFEWQALYPAAPPRSGVLWDYYRASADGMCSAQPSGVAEEVLQVWHVVRGGLERGRNKLREWSMR